MKSAAQPLIYRTVDILVEIFYAANAQLAKIAVPVLVRAYNAIDICVGESQVNRKSSSSEAIGIAREIDRAIRIRQMFAVILKGIQILTIVDEEARYSASLAKKTPSTEVDHEAAGRERMPDDISHVRPA
jgi:hypothetical protein